MAIAPEFMFASLAWRFHCWYDL